MPGFQREPSTVAYKSSAALSVTSGIDTPSNPGDLLREIDNHSRSSSGKETEQREGKLSLEGILNSFLLLAAEKDSAGLIRRVLQVLLQVTCTHYACLAILDPSSGYLKLKGYGRAFEEIKTCDKSLADCKSLAPTVVLTHASVARKVSEVDTATVLEAKAYSGYYRFSRCQSPVSSLKTPTFSLESRFLLARVPQSLCWFCRFLFKDDSLDFCASPVMFHLQGFSRIRSDSSQHLLQSCSRAIKRMRHWKLQSRYALSNCNMLFIRGLPSSAGFHTRSVHRCSRLADFAPSWKRRPTSQRVNEKICTS
jgi:hypothetical protein